MQENGLLAKFLVEVAQFQSDSIVDVRRWAVGFMEAAWYACAANAYTSIT